MYLIFLTITIATSPTFSYFTTYDSALVVIEIEVDNKDWGNK